MVLRPATRLCAAGLGIKFWQQSAIAAFIEYFVWLSYRLLVEGSEKIHGDPEQVDGNSGRTFVLKELGFPELRFPNDYVPPRLDQGLAPAGGTCHLPTRELYRPASLYLSIKEGRGRKFY